MTANISKEFHWEMGHRLPFHSGGCENIHGHSYVMRVELEGDIDDKGMVVDYFDVKATVQPLVDLMDHSFLCAESDEVMRAFFDKNPTLKVNYVAFHSTAENIALYLLGEIKKEFIKFPSVKKITVRVFETERTFAEVSSANSI